MPPRRAVLCRVTANVAVSLLAAVAQGTVIPTDKDHVVSLNGTWRFKLEQPGGDLPDPAVIGGAPNPIVTPSDPEPFHSPGYEEDGKWTDIPVPANWEMHGHSVATFNQPDNAIGLYRLSFVVPAAWKGRVVKINFDGIQNGAELYLNGQPVRVDDPSEGRPNYHQGGNTAFQVDLTPAVRFGEKNLLAVRVYKNTKAVDLDTGDYFFLGGVHRAVTLFSVPESHIVDYKVETKLLEGNRAELKVLVDKSDPAATVSMSLEGVSGGPAVESDKSNRVILTQVLDGPRLWSAEHPNLYTLNLDLKSADGKTIEHVSKKVGVREVSIKDGVLLVNNLPVKFTGMCRHEVYPTLGTAITEEVWRKDIALMKAANVNAIRTSHYPYGSGFYDLCDEMGMYVMDEMSAGWTPADEPAHFAAWAQHARELVRRDKNHPSVVIWAVGNENKPGPANKVAADEIAKLDTTRPRLVSWRDADHAGVELDDRHYTNPADVAYANRTARRASVPITYLENPNNWEARNGSDWGVTDRWAAVIDRTWGVTWDAIHIPGQFLWEWQDRAVADPNAKHLYDFDPATGVNLAKVKGVCDGFRNPRPAYYHVKMAYAPVRVTPAARVDGSAVTPDVTNHFSFTDLKELATTWRLIAAGKEVAAGDVRPALAPRSRGDVRLDLPRQAVAAADTLRVTFAHPAENREIATYDLSLKAKADTTPSLYSSALGGVTFPRFNLTVTTIVQNPIKWRRQTRLPGQLANITVQKAGGPSVPAPVKDAAALYAIPLSEVRSVDADIILADASTEVLSPGLPPPPPAVSGELGAFPPNAPADREKPTYGGHIRVDYANGHFSYTVNWFRQSDTRAQPADIQELGWVFTLPRSADQFSWDRQAHWSYYPETHIGRPTGTATPDSVTGQHASRISRPDAFDFNSTKYDCNWVKLADAGGKGVGVVFASNGRHHCRAETAKDGSHVLVVDLFNSPPRDLSSGVVNDLYYTLHRGQQATGSFRVGAIGGK